MEGKVDAARILVVEHDMNVADYIVDALQFQGWEVVGPAHTTSAALGQLEQFSGRTLHAAVLDLRLEMDFPIASLLRKRKIPFVFISGGIEGHDSLAFDDAVVLRKPFQFTELISAIQTLLASR